jgi:hypothetical protein
LPLIIAQTWDKNFFQPFTGVPFSRTAKVLTHAPHFLCSEYVEMYKYAVFCAHNIDKGWQTFYHLVPDFPEKVLTSSKWCQPSLCPHHPYKIIELFAVAHLVLVLLFLASVYIVCFEGNTVGTHFVLGMSHI